jgi:hypothetical protein
MKRRQVITAIGTLALGAGTALGTGAFDATSSSSDASMSIVTRSDANLDIIEGSGVGENNIQSGLLDSNEVEELKYDDFPVAAVENVGQGMVNIQILVEVGTNEEFPELLQIENYDDGAYNVGFEFTGFGAAVSPDGDLPEGTVPDIFTFHAGPGTGYQTISGNDLEPGGTPDTDKMIELGSGGSQPVTLGYNGSNSVLTSRYDSATGNFTGNTNHNNIAGEDAGTETKTLVDEVTAVATSVE